MTSRLTQIFSQAFRLVLLAVTLCLSACSSATNTSQFKFVEKPPKQSEDSFFVGEITGEELLAKERPFSSEYQSYQPSQDELTLFSRLEGMDIVVFFGIWCHDSQREVPRLLKLIEKSGVQLHYVSFVALNLDKKLPEKYQDNFKVAYTPTLFVMKDGQQLAKMVERPKMSISKDLVSQIFH